MIIAPSHISVIQKTYISYHYFWCFFYVTLLCYSLWCWFGFVVTSFVNRVIVLWAGLVLRWVTIFWSVVSVADQASQANSDRTFFSRYSYCHYVFVILIYFEDVQISVNLTKQVVLEKCIHELENKTGDYSLNQNSDDSQLSLAIPRGCSCYIDTFCCCADLPELEWAVSAGGAYSWAGEASLIIGRELCVWHDQRTWG